MAAPGNAKLEHSEDRILHLLKARGAQSATVLAGQLGMTAAGARQHLAALRRQGLIGFADQSGSVGRPKRIWRLTAAGHRRFPDSHADLTVSLIDSVRELFGDPGLDRLIAHRETLSRSQYAAALKGADGLGERVRRLAEIRSKEGYMAECSAAADGSHILIENHCPICAAATACQGFCRSEMAIFRAVLGPGIEIERIEHLLTGARRCAYHIRRVDAPR